ncbi:toxin YafO, type II toxin-antitoxin system family protein [Salmonella enterica subsp. enterica]|nr:toxin YafO, type II toxin-antitoxin system family protein [Salmonella enterica subsp. enterica]
MIYISVAKELSFSAAAYDYAVMLARYLGGVEVPGWLGNIGRFERNIKSIESGIWKMHIKALTDRPWADTVMLHERKSDNYLIYAQHWCYVEHYQIIGIVIPDAHIMSDKLLPGLIKSVESTFQYLNESGLKLLNHITV